jgi:hypothetical protein
LLNNQMTNKPRSVKNIKKNQNLAKIRLLRLFVKSIDMRCHFLYEPNILFQLAYFALAKSTAPISITIKSGPEILLIILAKRKC